MYVTRYIGTYRKYTTIKAGVFLKSSIGCPLFGKPFHTSNNRKTKHDGFISKYYIVVYDVV